jgi:hypothetical protein
MSTDDPEAVTPVQRRLDEHLELLRVEEPPGDPSLPERVVRSARWQRALRAPVAVVGVVAGAVVDGLRALVVGRGGSTR